MKDFNILQIKLNDKLLSKESLGWIYLLIRSCWWGCYTDFRKRFMFMSQFAILAFHFSSFERNSNILTRFLTMNLPHQIFRKHFECMYRWPSQLQEFYIVDCHYRFETTINFRQLTVHVITEWRETFDWAYYVFWTTVIILFDRIAKYESVSWILRKS